MFLVTIALAAPGWADYVGLEVVIGDDPTCQDQSQPEIPFDLEVCNVFAVFSNPADRLMAVGDVDISTTDPAGFFQHSWGGNTTPGCSLVPLFPDIVCDSYVTMSLACAAGSDDTKTDPDFDSTLFNTGGGVAGGWFNFNPGNTQGAPDADGRILIAQLSYKQVKNASGTVDIHAKIGGASPAIAFPLEAFDCDIPGLAPSPCFMWYVDADNVPPDPNNSCCTSAGGCTGWEDACPELQDVLALASPTDQIWVAEGTYTPTKCGPPGDACTTVDRQQSFQLLSGVKLYGGFVGDEVEFSERPALLLPTVLSGDIDENDSSISPLPDCDDAQPVGCQSVSDSISGSNSYHVVNGSGADAEALLDGFQITAGLANGASAADDDRGAGIYVDGGSPKIMNCLVSVNFAELGAGVYLKDSNANILETIDETVQWESCIANNLANTGPGGGCYIEGGAPRIVSTDIFNNTSIAGGGIYSLNASPAILGNRILSNDVTTPPSFGAQGGGIYLEGVGAGDIKLSGNLIEGNDVCRCADCVDACDFHVNGGCGGSGAGIYMKDISGDSGSTATVEFGTIRDNEAKNGSGGGIYCANAFPLISRVVFESNQAKFGAGIYNNTSNPTIADCEFSANGFSDPATPDAEKGGAMYNHDSGPSVTNCQFFDNQAVGSNAAGGAVFNFLDTPPASSPSFVNCLFARNDAKNGDGGAIYTTGGNSVVENCTFSENSAADFGGALFAAVETTIEITNCVMWGDTASVDGGPEASTAGALTFRYCDVEGGDTEIRVIGIGTLNWNDTDIDDDPLFVDPASSNYRLPGGSPANDAGDSIAAVAAGLTTDLDGRPRFVDDPGVVEDPGVPAPEYPDQVVDMGAYEFGPCGACPWDTDQSGDVRVPDLIVILGCWGSLPGNDPACPCLDIDDSGDVRVPDLIPLLGHWGVCP